MENLRSTKLKYIRGNIGDVDDNNINLLFDKVIETMPQKNKKSVNRRDKLLYIENNLRYVDGPNLECVWEIIANALNYEESIEDKRIRITLNILNKILKAINRRSIDNLCDFCNVRRDHLIGDITKNIINDNQQIIFEEVFTKKECITTQQSKLSYPHFSLLKGMLNVMGYEFIPTKKSKFANGKRDIFTIYSIQKIE